MINQNYTTYELVTCMKEMFTFDQFMYISQRITLNKSNKINENY